MNQFSLLFKKHRLKAEFCSLTEFGKALADEGFIYEDSIFSHWQKGDRIPINRILLLTIVKLFIVRGGMNNLSEVNSFLESTGQGYITDAELKKLTSFTPLTP